MTSQARRTCTLLGLVAVTGFGILAVPHSARAAERPYPVLAAAYDKDEWKERDKREREWDKHRAERLRERDKQRAEMQRERYKHRAEMERERAKDQREWEKRQAELDRDRRGGRDDDDDYRWRRSRSDRYDRDRYDRDYYDPQDRAGRPHVRVRPVRNRQDLDRDGIRNDRDRDIDGDGAPNRRDRHPYDRRRR